MCCFSKEVEKVANTRIFARREGLKHQFLAYQMSVQANEDLAMILPVPAKSVEFISLAEFPSFFDDLNKGFPEPTAKSLSLGPPTRGIHNRLEVVSVGAYEASFVPTAKDFDRLDPQFSIPSKVWDGIPLYQKGFGFVVFKLKKATKKAEVHPMAFKFESNYPGDVFFPTLHIHDEKVHPEAEFDHYLYMQSLSTGSNAKELMDWRESVQPAGMYMITGRSKGLLDPDAHVYRKGLHGMLANQDTVLSA
jgi:hypothetical protein